MKRLFAFIIFLISFCTQAYSQTGKSKKIVIENRASFVVPSSFGQPELVGSANDRTYRLLNKRETIMIVYALGKTSDPDAVEVGDNDIHEWADKQLHVLKNQPDCTYLDDGVFLQDGKNIGYIKFTKQQPGSWDTYHLLFFTSVDNKLVQLNFTCPLKMRKKWEPIADGIANSIRVEFIDSKERIEKTDKTPFLRQL